MLMEEQQWYLQNFYFVVIVGGNLIKTESKELWFYCFNSKIVCL